MFDFDFDQRLAAGALDVAIISSVPSRTQPEVIPRIAPPPAPLRLENAEVNPINVPSGLDSYMAEFLYG